MQGFGALRCSGLGLVIAYTLLRVYRRAKSKSQVKCPQQKGTSCFACARGSGCGFPESRFRGPGSGVSRVRGAVASGCWRSGSGSGCSG